jgi:hypothetical protein
MFTLIDVRVAGDHEVGRCEGKFLLPETSFCKSQAGKFFIIKKDESGRMSFLVFRKPKQDLECQLVGDLIPQAIENIYNSHKEVIHQEMEPVEVPCMFASREVAKKNVSLLNSGNISRLIVSKIKDRQVRLHFAPLQKEIDLESFLSLYGGVFV